MELSQTVGKTYKLELDDRTTIFHILRILGGDVVRYTVNGIERTAEGYALLHILRSCEEVK